MYFKTIISIEQVIINYKRETTTEFLFFFSSVLIGVGGRYTGTLTLIVTFYMTVCLVLYTSLYTS